MNQLADSRGYFTNTGGSTYGYYDGEYDLYVDFAYITFSGEKSIIKRIALTIRELKNHINYFGHSFDSKTYNELVYPYTLSGVLTSLGKPTSMQISTYSTDVDRYWEFKILLLYPDDGVLVQYTIPLQIKNNSVIGCPENAHIDLELMPAGDSDRFGQLLNETEWAGFWPPSDTPINGWKSVDQATDMTIDQFYATFRDNPKACISTPAELWK
jgi:hypothetical protein